MKTFKHTLMVIGIVGLLFGQAPGVWAAGAPGDLGCCVVQNPGGGALGIKATIALLYNDANKNVDVKLRLERGGQQEFFILNINELIYGMSNEEVCCIILNPNEPNVTDETRNSVSQLVADILWKFFPGLDPTKTRLVITLGSISDTDGPAAQEFYDYTTTPPTPTGRYFSVADALIYAVDSSKVKPVDPSCTLP